MRKVLCW